MNAAAVAPPRASTSGGKELPSLGGGGKHSFGGHAQRLENGLGSHTDRDVIWGSAA